MSKLTGVILSPDATLHREMERVLGGIEALNLIRPANNDYTNPSQLAAMLKSLSPEVVFVDSNQLNSAMDVASIVSREVPEAHMIAVGRKLDANQMRIGMQLGLRDFLPLPLRADDAIDALARLNSAVEAPGAGNVISFLPAKPGVGATTICVNTATAIANASKKRVALLDLDFGSGNVDFLLDLDAGYSVRDVAEHGERLTDTIWLRMITRSGNLDILRSGPPQSERPVSPSRLQAVLLYAKAHYDTVFLDLGSVGDPTTLEALRQSTRVFIVTTVDVASLHLAQRAIGVIKEQGIDDRLQLVVNRLDGRSAMNRLQVEELLGYDIAATMPNCWMTIQRGLTTGQAVVTSGSLASRIAEFANSLLEPKNGKPIGGGLFRQLGRVLSARAS